MRLAGECADMQVGYERLIHLILKLGVGYLAATVEKNAHLLRSSGHPQVRVALGILSGSFTQSHNTLGFLLNEFVCVSCRLLKSGPAITIARARAPMSIIRAA